MIEIVLDRSEEVAQWVASIMPYPGYERGFDTVAAIGCMENGRLIGGAVFHDWNPEARVIEFSGASISPRWLPMKMLNAVFTYIFDVVQCQACVMRVAEGNTRMRSIAERFGFDGFLIPRLAGPSEGLVIYTLTVEQWRASRFNRRRNKMKEAA